MVEGRFEEAKENDEPRFDERHPDLGEEKEQYVNHKVSSETRYSESESDEEDESKAPAQADSSKKRKRKKKKQKECKKALMSTFWRQIDLKAACPQMPLLPIEEYFHSRDLMSVLRKGDNALVLRLIQTHFKAKDYDAYKARSEIALSPDKSKVSEENKKFYERRYYLFSKYDQGIKLDEESIFY